MRKLPLFSRSWLFCYYRKRSRFAQALSLWPGQVSLDEGWRMWCAYRLGLYRSVAQGHWDGRHLEGGLAYTASLAANGDLQAARNVIDRFGEKLRNGRKAFRSAQILAPHAPALALEILEGVSEFSEASLSFRIALLHRCSRTTEARALMEWAIARAGGLSRLAQRDTELYLWASLLLEGGTPASQCANLNGYWNARGLSPVSLIDSQRSPSAVNVTPKGAIAPVNGPLISVLMTSYNAESRVTQALRSLLQQSYRNIEIIVVDDASTDNSVEAIKAVAHSDDRVRYMTLPCNGGPYVAKNIAYREARGVFIMCHDADDWSHPMRLEHQVAPLLNDERLVASTSCWVRVRDDGVYHARSTYPLIRLNPSSPMVRREGGIDLMGPWDAVRTGADSEFLARLKLYFGAHAVRRLSAMMALGAHHSASLMNAADTGYSPQGQSPQRLAYWEAWTKWHIAELRERRRPMMPGVDAHGQGKRPFPVEPEMIVPPNVIKQAVAMAGKAGEEWEA